MTITEIRKAFRHSIEFSKRIGNGVDRYIEREWRTFETLYKDGIVTDFSADFLARANGYQVTRAEYEHLHISQTFDLHRITATKAVTRAMMMDFLDLS